MNNFNSKTQLSFTCIFYHSFILGDILFFEWDLDSDVVTRWFIVSSWHYKCIYLYENVKLENCVIELFVSISMLWIHSLLNSFILYIIFQMSDMNFLFLNLKALLVLWEKLLQFMYIDIFIDVVIYLYD